MIAVFGIGPAELIIVLVIGIVMVVPVVIAAVVIFTAFSRNRQRQTGNADLAPCPDCGRMVSRLAPACPGCGRPLQ